MSTSKLSRLANEMTFTKDELVKLYEHFLTRLVDGHGNDREQMIKIHIDKLVGLSYRRVKQIRSRGPRNGWDGLMADLYFDMEALATQKAKQHSPMSVLS